MKNPNGCEQFQEHLSSLMDGELDPVQIVPSVDHLVDCGDCREFYRRARAIDALALVAPESVWERIRSARAPKTAGWPAWAAAVAASLVLAVGLSVVILDGIRRDEAPTALQAAVLEQPVASMTDERFVELARELLSSDRRYHREMLEVMQAISDRDHRGEGTLEAEYSRTENGLIGEDRSESTPGQTPGGPRS